MKKYQMVIIIGLFNIIHCRSISNNNNKIGLDSSKNTIISNEYIKYNLNNNNRIIFDSTYNINTYINNNIYESKVGLFYKKYIIEISSIYLDDTVSENESNIFYKIYTSQSINFFYENRLTKQITLPIKKIIQKNKIGKEIEMLENCIMNFGIIKGGKGDIIVIEGYGGCNSCTEFYGYYTLEGKEIAINYYSKEKEYNKTDNLYCFIDDYKIDFKELIGTEYSNLQVY